MKRSLVTLITTGVVFFLMQTAAKAAYSFTSTQTDTAPVVFTMKDTTSVTYQIRNTSTGGNVDQRVYQMRFRLRGTTGGTVFSSATTAPAGWTRTSFSTTSITFRANTVNDAIVCTTGGCAAGPTTSVNFTLRMTAGSYSADLNQSLRDVRAYFQNSTSSWPPSSSDQRITYSSGGSIGLWTLKSLLMTLVPSITSVSAGNTFTLTMTVTNKSTSNLTGITSNPKPPTRTYTGSAVVNTTSNPANLNLNAGATGTMVWTYTTNTSGPGTVTLQSYAGVGTRTSKTVASVPVSINLLSATIAVTPACLFSGQTASFVMTVTNSTASAVSNVSPSALTRGGAATIGAFSGPTPASVASLASSASTTFTWTTTVTGTAGSTYFVTGFANGNGGAAASPTATSTTEDVDGYLININTTDTNLSSTNQSLTWSIVNQACTDVQSVSISFPPDWAWGGGSEDGYSLVTNTLGNSVETWGVSGPTPGPVQFASPSSTDRIPFSEGGDFELVFSATPTSGTSSPFTVTVTDASGVVSPPQSVLVNLNAFNFNSLNQADTESYREEFR